MNKLGRLRISAAVGYIAPARIRPNLDILSEHHVVRALIKQGKCNGVEVINPRGEVVQLSARLVVLSCGALLSPCVLWRSGIGAAHDLQRIGVEQVVELPGVGQNLSDHPALAIVCEVKDGSLINFNAPIIQTILRYTAKDSDKRNDLQIEQISFAGKPGGPPRFVIAPVLEYQFGRGELTLSSADPYAAPEIHNRFCEHPTDALRLALCMQDALRFTQVGALGDMINQVQFPDPHRGHSLEDLQMLCRKFAGSGYHPCGTARMGPKEDTAAVVDAKGRCHQVEQLVVADASIMPHVPRANTNLTSIMIGEKIGEWIRTTQHDYGL